MTKILGLLLFLTIVNAQIIFNKSSPAEPDELFELLDIISTRQNIRNVSSSSCVTPNGDKGTCQQFSSCAAYVTLRNYLHRPSVLNFLRGRVCRVLGHTVHLCCPNSNVGTTLPPSGSVSQQECGSRPLFDNQSVKVFGGESTRPGEWPWLAVIGNREGRDFLVSCGGTLITRRHVLSAAHCFEPQERIPTMVRLGAYDLTRTTTSEPPQDFNIKERRDGGYNSTTKEDDITILILDRDATLNDYVQLACLPFKHRNENFLRDVLVITGWGRTLFEIPQTTNIPMKAVVPPKDTATCAKDYQHFKVVIDSRSLCAGDGSADACINDSGGPLHYLDLDDGKYYVVGIVSFGVRCGRPEYPGVYTRITSYLDWITRTVQ